MADHRRHSEAFARVVGNLVQAGRLDGGGPSGDDAPGGPAASSVRLELADIGSGAGVPGLILAERLPEVAVTLIERRAGRASWLEEAAGRLAREGIGIRVRCGDVYDLARGEARGRYDLVTARAFGSPAVTAELGGALLRTGGALVVSEPPDQPDRWNAVDLAGLGLVDDGPVAAGPVDGGGATPSPAADGPGSETVSPPTARFRVLVRRAPLASHRPRRKPRPA